MKKTAYVYDPFNLKHTREGHPENYHRLQGTWDLLQQDGILEQLIHVPSSEAPRPVLLSVHSGQYIELLEALNQRGGGRIDADTYMNADSYTAALLAAGGLLNLVDTVMTGKADNGFALIRPPGHHALVFHGMGFCLLANVALAARWAQRKYNVERILIVDYDVHHGNGTQDIFYGDPSVLFFSTHQFPFYPGSGAADEMGDEFAYGTTVNVPFPPGVGDEGYLQAFRKVLAPAALHFKPDLILVSAGYDAHWMDPLADERLTVSGYGALVNELLALADELCGGKIVFALEGGYNLEVLPHCILTTLRALSGDPRGPSDPFGQPNTHEKDVTGLLDRIRNLHHLR